MLAKSELVKIKLSAQVNSASNQCVVKAGHSVKLGQSVKGLLPCMSNNDDVLNFFHAFERTLE
jgi:hypothetical protein